MAPAVGIEPTARVSYFSGHQMQNAVGNFVTNLLCGCGAGCELVS